MLPKGNIHWATKEDGKGNDDHNLRETSSARDIAPDDFKEKHPLKEVYVDGSIIQARNELWGLHQQKTKRTYDGYNPRQLKDLAKKTKLQIENDLQLSIDRKSHWKKNKELELTKSGVATATAFTSKEQVMAFVRWLKETYDVHVIQAVKHNWEGHYATALDIHQGKAKEQGQWLPHWHIHFEIEMIERSTGRSVNSRGMRYTRALEKECWKEHETTLKSLDPPRRKTFIKQWKQEHAKRYPRAYFGIGRTLNFATISKKWADTAGLERGIEGSQAKHVPINQFIKNQTLQAEIFEQYGNTKELLQAAKEELKKTNDKIEKAKESFEKRAMLDCGNAYGLTVSETKEIQETTQKHNIESEVPMDVIQEIIRQGRQRMENELQNAKQKEYNEQIEKLLAEYKLPLNTYKKLEYAGRLEKVIALVVPKQINTELVRYKTDALAKADREIKETYLEDLARTYGLLKSEVSVIKVMVEANHPNHPNKWDLVEEEIKKKGEERMRANIIYDRLKTPPNDRKIGNEELKHAVELYEKHLVVEIEKSVFIDEEQTKKDYQEEQKQAIIKLIPDVSLKEKETIETNYKKSIVLTDVRKKMLVTDVENEYTTQSLNKLANQIYDASETPRYRHWSNGQAMTSIERINHSLQKLNEKAKHLTSKHNTLKNQVNLESIRQEVKQDIRQEEDQTYRLQVRASYNQQIEDQAHVITENQSTIKEQKGTIKALDTDITEKQKIINDLPDKKEEYTHLVKEIEYLKASPSRIHTEIWREGLILRIENTLDRETQRAIEEKQKALPAWEIEDIMEKYFPHEYQQIMQRQGPQRDPSLSIGF
ncbi:MAG: hypothetical protein OXE77_08955 [Flavobacteriaceae bacterium]|nr:hypothetical protein [Flavobacteriaceae bacterium]MCY4268512.1 hypothetical protein [Flavobacteriaceae bacterium]